MAFGRPEVCTHVSSHRAGLPGRVAVCPGARGLSPLWPPWALPRNRLTCGLSAATLSAAPAPEALWQCGQTRHPASASGTSLRVPAPGQKTRHVPGALSLQLQVPLGREEQLLPAHLWGQASACLLRAKTTGRLLGALPLQLQVSLGREEQLLPAHQQHPIGAISPLSFFCLDEP